MSDLLEKKFNDKFEAIAKEFKIPFSRLSDLLGLSKNSIYNIRKSHNWKPQSGWFIDNTKRLDHVRDLLLEYQNFALYHTKGKKGEYDADLFHLWVFTLWWTSRPRTEYLPVSPAPLPPTNEGPVESPPRPQTKEERWMEFMKERAADLLDVTKPAP